VGLIENYSTARKKVIYHVEKYRVDIGHCFDVSQSFAGDKEHEYLAT